MRFSYDFITVHTTVPNRHYPSALFAPLHMHTQTEKNKHKVPRRHFSNFECGQSPSHSWLIDPAQPPSPSPTHTHKHRKHYCYTNHTIQAAVNVRQIICKHSVKIEKSERKKENR